MRTRKRSKLQYMLYQSLDEALMRAGQHLQRVWKIHYCLRREIVPVRYSNAFPLRSGLERVFRTESPPLCPPLRKLNSWRGFTPLSCYKMNSSASGSSPRLPYFYPQPTAVFWDIQFLLPSCCGYPLPTTATAVFWAYTPLFTLPFSNSFAANPPSRAQMGGRKRSSEDALGDSPEIPNKRARSDEKRPARSPSVTKVVGMVRHWSWSSSHCCC